MKKYYGHRIAVTMFCILTACLSANGQNWSWVENSGGDCYSYGTIVRTDPAGNVYVFGHFAPSSMYSYEATFVIGNFTLYGGSNYSYFLAKYDQNGQLLWVRSDSIETSIAIDASGNIYQSDIRSDSIGDELFLKEYNSDGNIIWTKTIMKGAALGPAALLVDAEHNFYLDGYIETINGTTVEDSTFWLKCDSMGNIIWKKSVVGTILYLDAYNSMALDPAGNLLISGVLYDPDTIGDTISIGDTILICDSISATFLAKYDRNGTMIWFKSSQIFSNYMHITSDTNGNVYQTGDFFGSATFGSTTIYNSPNAPYVVKYDPSGAVLWVKSAHTDGQSYPFDITVDPSGNVYFTGWFSYPITVDSITLDGSPNTSTLFLFKLDQSGQVQWGFSGSQLGSRGGSVFADGDGNCYLTGGCEGEMNFGSHSITGTTSAFSMFVAKFRETPPPPPPLQNNYDILLYPNPASSYLTVRGGKNVVISEATIFNSIGQKMGQYNQAGNYWLDIDDLLLPDGVYILKATGPGNKFVIPFTVKH